MALTQHTKKYCVGVLAVCIVISFCFICPATASSMPIDENNPNNNYTVCSNDESIAYTEEFKKTYIPHWTTEFNDYYYLIHPTFINTRHYNGNIDTYIQYNIQYLLENPQSKILLNIDTETPNQCIAESYTDRDTNSNYINDDFIDSYTNPDTDLQTQCYIHREVIDKLYYAINYKNLDWIGITNPAFPDKTINKVYGKTKPDKYSVELLSSDIIKNQATIKNNVFYFNHKFNITTLFQYIITEFEPLIDSPNSKIYLNIAGHGWFRNREIVAFSTTEDLGLKYTSYMQIYNHPSQFTGLCLVQKTQGRDDSVNIYFNMDVINQLLSELEYNDFKWIYTYNSQYGYMDEIWGQSYITK